MRARTLQLMAQLAETLTVAPRSPEYCRARQCIGVSKMLTIVDQLIEEAAEARISAPGLIETREWLVFCIESNAEQAERLKPESGINSAPDPVKDAVHASISAAFKGADEYTRARAAEEAARAAA